MLTPIPVGGRSFDPTHLHLAPDDLRGMGGAYFIGRITWSNPLRIIDYDQAEDVGVAVANHPRRPCWLRHGHQLELVVYLCESDTEGQRLQDEARVREKGPFPCRAD